MADYFDFLRKLQDDVAEQKEELTEIERFIIWAREEFKRLKENQENESGLPS